MMWRMCAGLFAATWLAFGLAPGVVADPGQRSGPLRQSSPQDVCENLLSGCGGQFRVSDIALQSKCVKLINKPLTILGNATGDIGTRQDQIDAATVNRVLEGFQFNGMIGQNKDRAIDLRLFSPLCNAAVSCDQSDHDPGQIYSCVGMKLSDLRAPAPGPAEPQTVTMIVPPPAAPNATGAQEFSLSGTPPDQSVAGASRNNGAPPPSPAPQAIIPLPTNPSPSNPPPPAVVPTPASTVAETSTPNPRQIISPATAVDTGSYDEEVWLGWRYWVTALLLAIAAASATGIIVWKLLGFGNSAALEPDDAGGAAMEPTWKDKFSSLWRATDRQASRDPVNGAGKRPPGQPAQVAASGDELTPIERELRDLQRRHNDLLNEGCDRKRESDALQKQLEEAKRNYADVAADRLRLQHEINQRDYAFKVGLPKFMSGRDDTFLKLLRTGQRKSPEAAIRLEASLRSYATTIQYGGDENEFTLRVYEVGERLLGLLRTLDVEDLPHQAIYEEAIAWMTAINNECYGKCMAYLPPIGSSYNDREMSADRIGIRVSGHLAWGVRDSRGVVARTAKVE